MVQVFRRSILLAFAIIFLILIVIFFDVFSQILKYVKCDDGSEEKLHAQ